MINLWRQDPHNKYGKELFDNVPSDFTKTDNRASHHTSFTQIIMTNIISMNLPVKNVNKRDSKKEELVDKVRMICITKKEKTVQ